MKYFYAVMLSVATISLASCSQDEDDEPLPDNNKKEQGVTIDFNKYFTEKQFSDANTASNCDYLNSDEKVMILYMNLARTDGEAFTQAFLSDLLESTNEDEQSLISDLKAVKNRPLLIPNKKLSEAAEFHANDIGKNGETGHNSTDGTSFDIRIRGFYNGGAIAENIAYGSNDPVAYLRMLLIDQGVSKRGHRKNILNEAYCRIGIAIRQHKKWDHCCVQDFSDSLGD